MRKTLDYIFPDPPAGLNPEDLDQSNIPTHIAVIMDGNGRWAQQRSKTRLSGHKAGIEAVRETIRCANDMGVDYLTIYAFSSENWKRPQDEVTGLMDLFAKTMLAEVDELDKEGVRVKAIGELRALPPKTRAAFETAWEQTKDNSGMTLLVCVNYGGRQEILAALQSYLDSAPEGERAPLDEQEFSRHLYTAHIPDPDLLIRTSGEMRISNFLLWQIAYSEFYCTSVLWPDFDRYELLRAVLDYQGRTRRFGAI